MDLTILEALEVTATEVKEYVDDKPVIYYGGAQYLDAASRMTAKNNVGVFVSTDEPANALDGDIWIDTDVDVDISGGSNTNIQLDDTLTVSGMAADAKAVGDAIQNIEADIDSTYYVGQVISVSMVRADDVITATMRLDSGDTITSKINLNDEGYPVTITTDGVKCDVSWEGFDG